MFFIECKCLILQHRMRIESERQRKAEEEKLKKQMNAKKAKEEAERLHRVNNYKICYLQANMLGHVIM